MKKYIWAILLIALMFSSFLISGLFFLNLGIINSDLDDIDDEHTEKILIELDRLPLVDINPYEVNFYSRGIFEGNENGKLIINSQGEIKEFYYEGNDSFEQGDSVEIYYNFLPEGEKKIFWIRKR